MRKGNGLDFEHPIARRDARAARKGNRGARGGAPRLYRGMTVVCVLRKPAARWSPAGPSAPR